MGYDILSMNAMEPFGMVWIAYVMILIRKEVPGREGARGGVYS